ncbi:MAG: hypothetical protein COS89_09565, partial [Deltaproteobacteria bacterium CG07_land_8_20_14_0_80_38_7]
MKGKIIIFVLALIIGISIYGIKVANAGLDNPLVDIDNLQNAQPDSDCDEDDVVYQNDDCPFHSGPSETDGCPDTDGDGIRDFIYVLIGSDE